ncbi:MAG: hypothetical protein J6M39_06865 [Lachnospiraceae bacterium]|nr:hypothetical protein [Lachnospiraceae bacterium]
MEELKKLVAELRESGAEPEDIAQVVQELNMEMEMAKAITPIPVGITNKGGGKGHRRSMKNG